MLNKIKQKQIIKVGYNIIIIILSLGYETKHEGISLTAKKKVRKKD